MTNKVVDTAPVKLVDLDDYLLHINQTTELMMLQIKDDVAADVKAGYCGLRICLCCDRSA